MTGAKYTACATLWPKYQHLRHNEYGELTFCNRVTGIVRGRDTALANRPMCKECERELIRLYRPNHLSKWLQGRTKFNPHGGHVFESKEDLQKMKSIAHRRGLSTVELVRTYIEWGLEKDQED